MRLNRITLLSKQNESITQGNAVLQGGHVAEYMTEMRDEEPEKYKEHFARVSYNHFSWTA